MLPGIFLAVDRYLSTFPHYRPPVSGCENTIRIERKITFAGIVDAVWCLDTEKTLADQGQIEIIAPGVEHAFFAPGDQAGARAAIDVPPDVPMILFVGRIQPLKGPDVAIRALHALGRPDAQLLIVGGASGSDGDSEVERAHQLVDELGLHDRVRFVPPQPHHREDRRPQT